MSSKNGTDIKDTELSTIRFNTTKPHHKKLVKAYRLLAGEIIFVASQTGACTARDVIPSLGNWPCALDIQVFFVAIIGSNIVITDVTYQPTYLFITGVCYEIAIVLNIFFYHNISHCRSKPTINVTKVIAPVPLLKSYLTLLTNFPIATLWKSYKTDKIHRYPGSA